MTSIEDPQPEPEPNGRPLGEIFVDLGLITRDQLDDALEVQERTGGKLGEILVAQGVLSRLDLATALAERWEPRDMTLRPGPSVSSLTPRSSSFALAKGDSGGSESSARAPDAGGEAPRPDQLDRGEDAFAAIEERLTALTRRCSDLEVELVARTTETNALRARVAELHDVGCLAFAPTAVGYRLVELSGGPPQIGATVVLEDSEDLLVVTRLGRSPLPFDSRTCAYLDRV